MKAPLGVLMACLALTMAAATARAQDLPGTPVGSIRGEILPATGENQIPQTITVRLIGPGVQKVTFAMGSQFEFNGMPEGTYLLSVAAEGRKESVIELPGWSPVNGDQLVLVVLGPRTNSDQLPPSGAETVSMRGLKVPEKAQREMAKAAEAAQKNRSDKVEEHLRKAIDIYPDYSEALNNLGVLHLREGDLASAEKEFGKAVQADPDNILALKNLGYIRLSNGHAAEAVDALSRASRLDSNDPHLEAYLGEGYFLTDQLKQAEEHLEKSLVLDPKQPLPNYRLGFIYLAQKLYGDALKHFRAFLGLNPNQGRAEVESEVAHLESYFKDTLARNAANPLP